MLACIHKEKTPLCIIEGSGKLEVCHKNNMNEACIGQNNKPISCDGQKSETSSMDEKFMRLTCKNCSIDNTLVVVGTPEDVLPEAEVITFSP